jgi:hypothetical protein
LEHCCQSRHYTFQIKKCGESNCTICKPVKSNLEKFKKIHFLPDPVPNINQTKYKSFNELYGTNTTESYRPSLIQLTKNKQKEKILCSMGFNASAQCAKNTGFVIQCSECNKWRVLYSRTKLTVTEDTQLERFLDTIEYICGDTFDGLVDLSNSLDTKNIKEVDKNINEENSLDVDDDTVNEDSNNDKWENVEEEIDSDNISNLFLKVKVNNALTCNSPMEIPYYTCKLYEELCFNCGLVERKEGEGLNDNNYFYCEECNPIVSEKKRKTKAVIFKSKSKKVRASKKK